MQDLTALIVAAGKGRRFGGLKQFAKLFGEPLIYHSVMAFAGVPDTSEVVLVVPPRLVEETGRNLLKLRLRTPVAVVAGGRLRQNSVQNGLRLVRTRYVAVHDGARPFVSQELIRRGLAEVRRRKAVIFGLPVFDTIKRVKGTKVRATISRTDLVAVQTPQFFEVSLLRRCYAKIRANSVEYTDDASVVESVGIPVFLFPGDFQNVKITYRRQIDLIDKSRNRCRIRKGYD